MISKILGDDVQIEEGRLKLREVATQSGAEVALFDLEADFTQRDSEGVIESEVKGSVSVAVDGTRVQSIEFAGPMRATMDELEGLSLEGEMTMRSEYRCRD